MRVVLVATCSYASWWSIRMARADWLAESGPPEALAEAVRLEPGDARLRAVNAIIRSDNGDSSLAADRDLQEASQLNPFDSTVLMTLGLRAEFRGDQRAAEHYLVQATEVDRQFKPAWTLANFYARVHQPDKIWPLLKRCLDLDPLGFDPRPVFDLCWTYSDDPTRILPLIPQRRPRLIEYFSYLVATGRVDAAVQVWPRALSLANPLDDALTLFPGMLVRAGRAGEAVSAWNQMVDKGGIRSAKLNPAAGRSIADPSFAMPVTEGVFSWHLVNSGGVFARPLASSLQFEFDGEQPENVVLLQTLAPVVPGRNYRLKWKTDSSRLSLPADPGFGVRIFRQQDGEPVVCPLLLNGPQCTFSAIDETVRFEIFYSRAPGTVRARGALELLQFSLEFAS